MSWLHQKPESRAKQIAVATKHGLYKTPEYAAWVSMRHRCYNPKATHYEDYGGRGITVCARWLESPQNFLADMGPRPSPKHQIERLENNGNYEPGNCVWATRQDQCNNRRSNVLITHNGKTQNATRWGAELGINPKNIQQRIRVYKMPPHLALSTVSLLNSGRRRVR